MQGIYYPRSKDGQSPLESRGQGWNCNESGAYSISAISLSLRSALFFFFLRFVMDYHGSCCGYIFILFCLRFLNILYDTGLNYSQPVSLLIFPFHPFLYSLLQEFWLEAKYMTCLPQYSLYFPHPRRKVWWGAGYLHDCKESSPKVLISSKEESSNCIQSDFIYYMW